MTRALKITFDLAAPVVDRGVPIHLDALLSFALVRKLGLGGAHDVTWEPHECPPLPLARMRWGRAWWYRASAAWLSAAEPRSQMAWTKRWERDREDLLDLGRANQVTLKLGRYKEAHVPLEIVTVPRITFFAVGHQRRVHKLCKAVRHVGAKASQGFGLVRSVSVEPLELVGFERDWREDDRPARNLPADFARLRGLRVATTMRAPLRPPYWRLREEHTAEVAVPR